MTNIIITSEMRVGSRWMHYLLAELLHYHTSPELDVNFLTAKSKQVEINQRFKAKKIVKFHHATQHDLFEGLEGDFKVIGIVRNPNDRLTSWTFHQRYKPPGKGLQEIKDVPTDKEAVKIALKNNGVKEANERQFILMEKGYSTKQLKLGDPGEYGEYEQKYIWTSYNWLITDTFGEIRKICDFLGVNISDIAIRRACIKHSFKNKSGRARGIEKRNDEWRRKGIQGDHLNFFNDEMLIENLEIQRKYWDTLKDEENTS